MKERIRWIDFLSGVMIIWMILYHIFIFTGNKEAQICDGLYKIFFFFMPWFFFKSGMFVKEIPIKNVIVSGFKKLLVPYFLFSIFGYIAYVIQQVIISDISVDSMFIDPAITLLFTGSVLGNLPLWFLLALFLDKVLWQIFIKLKLNNYIIALLSFIICFGGYLGGIKIPFYLWFTFSGLFFYSMGDFFRYLQFKDIIFLLAIILYVIAILFFPNSVQMRSNSLEFGYYALWPVTGLAAIIVWNNLSYKIETIKSRMTLLNKVLGGVSLVGHNSLYLFITHSLILVPASAAVKSHFTNLGQFCVVFFVVATLLPVFSIFAKSLLDTVEQRIIIKQS